MERVTLEGIERATALAERDLEVPEWAGSVRIRKLTQGDYVAITEEVGSDPESGRPKDVNRAGMLMICRSVIEPELSYELLLRQPLSVVAFLSTQITAFSGVGPESFRDGGEADDAR